MPTELAVLRTQDVCGWPLAIVLEGRQEEARIGHRELARRLGYADARGPERLLELARRIWGQELPVPYREFREGSRGPRSREYLFNRQQALKLIIRSETPVADVIQDEVIAVYQAYLDQRPLAPSQINLAELTTAITASLGPAINTAVTAALGASVAPVLVDLSSRISALEARSFTPEQDEAAYIDENRKKELRGLVYQAKKALGQPFAVVREQLFRHFNVTEYGRLRNREFAAARQFLFDLLDQAREPAPTAPENPPTDKGELVDTVQILKEWRPEFGAYFGMRQLEELAKQMGIYIHHNPGDTPRGHRGAFYRADFERMKVYQRRTFAGTSGTTNNN